MSPVESVRKKKKQEEKRVEEKKAEEEEGEREGGQEGQEKMLGSVELVSRP